MSRHEDFFGNDPGASVAECRKIRLVADPPHAQTMLQKWRAASPVAVFPWQAPRPFVP
jgi:hypothetical protein